MVHVPKPSTTTSISLQRSAPLATKPRATTVWKSSKADDRCPHHRPLVHRHCHGSKCRSLGLGIGKAAGATLTLIPEEFDQRPFRLDQLVDTIVGSVLGGIAEGRKDGVAVVAEGVVLDLDERDLQGLGKVERDDHGHMRIAEINVGEGLRSAVRERLAELGHDITFVSGHRLRVALHRPHPRCGHP